MVNISLILIAGSVLASVRRSGVLERQGERSTVESFVRLRPAGADNVRSGECGKRPKTARPGRLHRGAAGSTTTIRSMNLPEERYLPGDEALRIIRATCITRHTCQMSVMAREVLWSEGVVPIWALLVRVYFWPARWLSRAMLNSRTATLSHQCRCGNAKDAGELLCDECKAW
jgi:hypothetical protein